jgi:hypothetical protein
MSSLLTHEVRRLGVAADTSEFFCLVVSVCCDSSSKAGKKDDNPFAPNFTKFIVLNILICSSLSIIFLAIARCRSISIVWRHSPMQAASLSHSLLSHSPDSSHE